MLSNLVKRYSITLFQLGQIGNSYFALKKAEEAIPDNNMLASWLFKAKIALENGSILISIKYTNPGSGGRKGMHNYRETRVGKPWYIFFNILLLLFFQ